MTFGRSWPFVEIVIIDAASGADLAEISGTRDSPYDGGALFPSWSPDGHALAFLDDVSDSYNAIDINIFDLRSRRIRRVRRLPARGSSEAARPDWQRLGAAKTQ